MYIIYIFKKFNFKCTIVYKFMNLLLIFANITFLIYLKLLETSRIDQLIANCSVYFSISSLDRNKLLDLKNVRD